MQQEAAIDRQELTQAMLGIAPMLTALDEERPTVLRKLNSAENKSDRLLLNE
jgi:hypothetical protein